MYVIKMRWRDERDYQNLKQDFGLSHFEGRNWRGFHRHSTWHWKQWQLDFASDAAELDRVGAAAELQYGSCVRPVQRTVLKSHLAFRVGWFGRSVPFQKIQWAIFCFIKHAPEIFSDYTHAHQLQPAKE